MFGQRQSQFYAPLTVARASGIRAGHTVVDLLSGHHGHVVFPAASLAGPSGVVHAVDIRQSALEALRGQCELGYVGNIQPVRGHVEQSGGVPLEDGSADVVLLVDSLSLLRDRLETVREAVRLLRSGGILTVVDWHTHGDVRHGPDGAQRLSHQEARSLCLVHELDYEGEFDAGDYHYGFTCRKR